MLDPVVGLRNFLAGGIKASKSARDKAVRAGQPTEAAYRQGQLEAFEALLEEVNAQWKETK